MTEINKTDQRKLNTAIKVITTYHNRVHEAQSFINNYLTETFFDDAVMDNDQLIDGLMGGAGMVSSMSLKDIVETTNQVAREKQRDWKDVTLKP
tara:strand:- start:5521 stop:5802 length:282 start_codon:yes stop_codon:yes gene_type:complete